MFGISTFWLSGASFRLAPQNFGGLLQCSKRTLENIESRFQPFQQKKIFSVNGTIAPPSR
jgi:hypothetical protein